MHSLNSKTILVMKKVLFSIAIAFVATVFSSCEQSDEARCWEITYSSTIGTASTEVTYYLYASENEVDATYGKYENFRKEKANMSETDCALANLGLETK